MIYGTAGFSLITLGAGRGTRTHTAVRPADFKSAASTIPPSRQFRLVLTVAVEGVFKGMGTLSSP